MISGDAPLSAFIPCRFHRAFLDVLNDLKFGDLGSMDTVKSYCSELYNLLKVCSSNNQDIELLIEVCNFLQSLVATIQDWFKGIARAALAFKHLLDSRHLYLLKFTWFSSCPLQKTQTLPLPNHWIEPTILHLGLLITSHPMENSSV